MRRLSCRFVAVAIFAAMLGCEEDDIAPQSDFRRPTGLAFIERPTLVACPALLVETSRLEELRAEQSSEVMDIVEANVVTRASFQEAFRGVRQGTLLVADAEAEGVRVQQFEQAVDVAAVTSTATELPTTRFSIVPGPTVFFPLVLSTPGFPSRVAVSKDTYRIAQACSVPETIVVGTSTVPGVETSTVVLYENADGVADVETVVIEREAVGGTRSFVLSNLGGANGGSASISIIDTLPRPFPARAQDYVGFDLGSLDLGAHPATAGAYTSIDLEAVGFVGCDDVTILAAGDVDLSGAQVLCEVEEGTLVSEQGVDLIALLQDPILGTDARLVFIAIPRDGSDPTFETVSLPAPAHPTGMALFDDRVVISNSAGNDIFEVPYAVRPVVGPASTATITAGQLLDLGAVRRIDVGGPTSGVVNGEQLGGFAVRLDVPRLVHLVDQGGRLTRGTERLVSPFEVEADPGNPERLGQLDFPDSPIVAATLGRLALLQQLVGDEGTLSAIGTEDFFGDNRAPVVMVTSADATVLFVVGSPPRLAILRDDRIQSIQRLETDQPDGFTRLQIVGCDARNLGVLESEDDLAEGQETEVILSGETVITDPDGPVPACVANASTIVACNDEVTLGVTTRTGVYRATHRGAVFTTETGTITVDLTGESHPVRVPVTDIDTTDAEIRVGDRVLYATTSTTPGCNFEGTVVDFDDERLEFEFDDDGPTLAGCDDQTIQWLEVYPAGDDAVFALYAGSRLAEVLQRKQVTRMGGTATATVTDFVVRFEGEARSGEPLPFEFTLRGAAPTVEEGFETRVDGRVCSLLGNQCPGDLECFAEAPQEEFSDEIRTCLNRCQCPAGVTCETEDPRLVRPGVEIFFNAAPVIGTQLADSFGGSSTPLALPEDVTFAPMLGSWLISVPGTRALAQVQPLNDLIGQAVTR